MQGRLFEVEKDKVEGLSGFRYQLEFHNVINIHWRRPSLFLRRGAGRDPRKRRLGKDHARSAKNVVRMKVIHDAYVGLGDIPSGLIRVRIGLVHRHQTSSLNAQRGQHRRENLRLGLWAPQIFEDHHLVRLDLRQNGVVTG